MSRKAKFEVNMSRLNNNRFFVLRNMETSRNFQIVTQDIDGYITNVTPEFGKVFEIGMTQADWFPEWYIHSSDVDDICGWVMRSIADYQQSINAPVNDLQVHWL